MKYYFNGTELTPETILKTRQHFYDICMGCIKDAQSGKTYVNDLEKYIILETESGASYLNGENDRTFTFLQRAHYLQTGESVALMNF